MSKSAYVVLRTYVCLYRGAAVGVSVPLQEAAASCYEGPGSVYNIGLLRFARRWVWQGQNTVLRAWTIVLVSTQDSPVCPHPPLHASVHPSLPSLWITASSTSLPFLIDFTPPQFVLTNLIAVSLSYWSCQKINQLNLMPVTSRERNSKYHIIQKNI